MEVPKISKDSPEKKLSWLRSQIIGSNAEFTSPFGKRRLTYADSTASGRSLHFIQDYLFNAVLPFYGNTHTSDSYVGQQSTKMMEEASRYIKKCMGGGEEDVILLCGSGTTAAIKRFQEVLGIAIPSTLRERVSQIVRDEEKWVLFVGPYEHHSNLLSWRQSLAQVVEIGFTQDGSSIDLENLRAQLEIYIKSNRPMLGSFSACSNVTGIVSDTRAIARLLHEYGAFACFDFAASGPYVKINMRSGEIDGYDAIFVSPHKFIGGPGSPGILLMSKKLYQLSSSPPSTCGGGTVSYVNGFNDEDTIYLDDVEERENAGTPPILQTVTAALAFWIKEYIGYTTIDKQEKYYITEATERLGSMKNIHILGNTSVKRQAILSFLIYPNITSQGNSKPLNGRFVAKLMNDLFGIQARGGCACSGPYAHYLLNVDNAYSLAFRSSIQKGYEGVKPGWTRVSFPYYMSYEEFEFILTTIEFVAKYGHKFIPLYNFNLNNGNWSFNEKALKEALPSNITTDNVINFYHDHHDDHDHQYDNKLSSLLKELKLNKPSYREQIMKGYCQNVTMTKMYSSYLKTAMRITSLLPNNSTTTTHRYNIIPHHLLSDLPFMI